MEEKLLIIIGLPGSGKSTYAINNLKNYVIYDDFITNFYNGWAIDSIKSGENVCLIDPRLCYYKTFKKYMKRILNHIDKNKIKLILFKNEVNTCIYNIRNRENNGLLLFISIYTKLYDINNYNEYNFDIMEPYDNPKNRIII